MRSKNNKKNKQHINLLVTIDKNYLLPLITMMQSYSQVHREVTTDVYLVHSALEEKDIKLLVDEVDDKNINVHSIKITKNWFSDTPVLERLPKESFYRLMAFDYLPKEVECCLYLDPDIYIRKSLLPLYNMEMGNSYIAGASHLYGFINFINKARLNLTNQERYINSGIMLMNIKQIREDFTVESIFESLEDKLSILKKNIINNLEYDRSNEISEDLIESYVEKIVVGKDRYKWKLNYLKDIYDLNTLKNISASEINNDSKDFYLTTIIITDDDVKNYRKRLRTCGLERAKKLKNNIVVDLYI